MIDISEHALQAKCFIHHWNAYPEYRGLLFHVNNKSRNAIEGNKMRSLGVCSGIPDLVYLFKKNAFGIEMKTEDGVVSKDQKNIHAKWSEHGIKVYICRNFEQFQEIINEIHNSL